MLDIKPLFDHRISHLLVSIQYGIYKCILSIIAPEGRIKRAEHEAGRNRSSVNEMQSRNGKTISNEVRYCRNSHGNLAASIA